MTTYLSDIELTRVATARNPKDKAARLAYADALEEAGDVVEAVMQRLHAVRAEAIDRDDARYMPGGCAASALREWPSAVAWVNLGRAGGNPKGLRVCRLQPGDQPTIVGCFEYASDTVYGVTVDPFAC